MADIAPELYEKIQKAFQQNMNSNKQIIRFWSRKEHTAKEVSLYAAALGKCASGALSEVLTEEVLPNGKLYWNIAQRTIVPLLKEAYEMVMEAADEVQRKEDEAIGIALKPIRPKFPENRINDMINKLIEYQEEKDG